MSIGERADPQPALALSTTSWPQAPAEGAQSQRLPTILNSALAANTSSTGRI